MIIPFAASHRPKSLAAATLAVAVLAGPVTWATDIDPQPDRLSAATPAVRQTDAGEALSRLLPPRSDTAADWYAPLEPLHRCGEPRLLPTCVPPPPCHPALPPQPLDLVGLPGAPTCGPIYRGPCAPRTGTHDDCPHPRIQRLHDRLFDWFYTPRTPILP